MSNKIEEMSFEELEKESKRPDIDVFRKAEIMDRMQELNPTMQTMKPNDSQFECVGCGS